MSSENQNLAYFPDQPIGTRLKKPTEKGKAYQLEILSQKRQTCYHKLSSLTQRAYEILDAENQISTLETLEDIRDVLDKSKEELNHAQNNLYELLKNESERRESYNWFDLQDQEFMECRLRLIERIQLLEKVQSQNSIAKSVTSGKSRRSEA
ncbi:Hypothetical predicted protein, partial [Paramuricea clavata]